MAVITVIADNPSRAQIDTAARELESGLVIAVPTDTAYALVADVSYTSASDRLFKIKKRVRTHDFPVIVADIEQAMSLTTGVPPIAETLMEKFWPGPLTLVLPRHPDFIGDLGDDDETVGVRCPDHIFPRLLCEEVGPLAITTANIAGRQPATAADEVVEMFGDSVSLVCDAGTIDHNLATVIDATGLAPKLLREGQIAWDDLQAVFEG